MVSSKNRENVSMGVYENVTKSRGVAVKGNNITMMDRWYQYIIPSASIAPASCKNLLHMLSSERKYREKRSFRGRMLCSKRHSAGMKWIP